MDSRRPTGTLLAKGENARHEPKWLIRIDYGRKPNGSRDRRAVAFTGSRKGAERKLTELLAQRDAGLTPSPEKTTVAEWFRDWLKLHTAEGHLSDSGQERYDGIIEHHIIPQLGTMTVKQVRGQHITQLKTQWLETLKPATVYKHLVVLRQAFEAAVAANLIVRNPADAVQNPSVVRGRREQRALTEAEIRKLLDAAVGTRFDHPIRFTLATGVREGELLSLLWSDVDLKRRVINLRGTKSANSRRSIEISKVIVDLLEAHRTAQKEARLKLGPARPNADLVFPSTVGTRWARRAFYRDYKKVVDATKDLERPDEVKWHTLRHTAASLWIMRGADVFTVSRRLGHASAAFTMDTYAHLFKGQQKVAAQALDGLLRRA
ncbi:MAG: site-specific integrase [Dehalococcoidia bacterium]|nr:site-specific integrase [Dehalococcoidia bacterium]